MGQMTIGELAKAANVNRQTLRYYERRKLLIPGSRSDSNYRFYAADALNRIKFIKGAQDLGFTLHEIDELLKLKISSASVCQSVKNRTTEKLNSVREKIQALQQMEKSLLGLLKKCDKNEKTSCCPLIESLET